MKIITADERLREKSGVKMLIAGPAKIGKTSQLRTLDPQRTLFIDLEAGDLAVKDVPAATLRPQTWPQCRDLACFLTGPNPSLPPTACYSQAHYDAIRAEFEGLQLDRFDTYFVDSLTVVGRLCFRHSEQQPEAFSERTGQKDVRGAYGLHAREMIGWATHLQHARGKNVIFVAILERIIDEFNRAEWAIQIEGTENRTRAAGNRRSDRHDEFRRLRRRQAAVACLHLHARIPGVIPLAIAPESLNGSSRRSRQTDREADRPRPAQTRFIFTHRANAQDSRRKNMA